MEEGFLESCAYVATFLGTLLEGELSLITSVVTAKAGFFNFYISMITAFFGAWIADWFKFIVGKKKGRQLLHKKPKLEKRVSKYTEWFEKHPYLILSFYKFFLGFTTVFLIISRIKNISYTRFAIHSGISVALWLLVLGGLSYHCADLVLSNLEWVSANITKIILILAGIAFISRLFIKRPYRKYCLTYKPI